MGAYGLPRGAWQPCPPIGGCSASDLCHTLLWTGLAVPIPSKGGALEVPHLGLCIRYRRAGISAAAGIFELTLWPYFLAPGQIKHYQVETTQVQWSIHGAQQYSPYTSGFMIFQLSGLRLTF